VRTGAAREEKSNEILKPKVEKEEKNFPIESIANVVSLFCK